MGGVWLYLDFTALSILAPLALMRSHVWTLALAICGALLAAEAPFRMRIARQGWRNPHRFNPSTSARRPTSSLRFPPHTSPPSCPRSTALLSNGLFERAYWQAHSSAFIALSVYLLRSLPALRLLLADAGVKAPFSADGFYFHAMAGKGGPKGRRDGKVTWYARSTLLVPVVPVTARAVVVLFGWAGLSMMARQESRQADEEEEEDVRVGN